MHEDLLLRLGTTVGFLRAVAANGCADQFGVRPSGHVFALTEHIWHLRDFELMAVRPRIDAILAHDTPQIVEFDGDAVAKNRRYLERDWVEALNEFAVARTANIEKLRSLRQTDWKRTALFHGFGPVNLLDLMRMTAEHDDQHIREILALGQDCPIWEMSSAA